MGYTPQRTVYKLRFTDPGKEGLEVRIQAPNVGTLLGMERFSRVKKIIQTDEDRQRWQDTLDVLEEHMQGWNVQDDDGQPVQPDQAGLKAQEPAFVYDIVVEWIKAIAGISGPLEQPSPDGEPYPEESIPMEPS